MFARPVLLLLLLAIPIWWWLRYRRRTPTVSYSDARQFVDAASRRRWLAEIPVGLRTLAVAAWVLAAAGMIEAKHVAGLQRVDHAVGEDFAAQSQHVVRAYRALGGNLFDEFGGRKGFAHVSA